MNKKELRAQLKKQRAAYAPSLRARWSALICKALLSSDFFEQAKTVALYAAMSDEADPSPLEGPLLHRGLELAYPRVQGDELIFHTAQRSELQPVPPWKILEPPQDMPKALVLDRIIVPGLGFTWTGARIGYGRGFYDRAISEAKAQNDQLKTVGFAFSSQVIEQLPTDAWDQYLDGLVTERGYVTRTFGH